MGKYGNSSIGLIGATVYVLATSGDPATAQWQEEIRFFLFDAGSAVRCR